MPEIMKGVRLSASVTGGQDEEIRLRPLRRIGQLAGDIQQALRRGDMGLVGQASQLLAPALAQWAEARLPHDEHNAEVGQLTQEARQALAACETALTRAMSDAREQQGQVRRQQKRIQQARAHKTPSSRSTGATLNLCK